MGLDMNLVARDPKQPDEPFRDIHYWRKHNAVHNWFETKWRKMTLAEFNANSGLNEDMYTDKETWKEMQEASFNCIAMFLSKELLTEFRTDIEESNLKTSGGFFFGSTDYDPAEYKADDLEAANTGLAALAAGDVVAYDCWW